ncbi:MAG: DUF2069 domain-containing protein [Proteobacteria bacterium]|uniref:DUF2069 domain-containing protein n=1 Tax=Aquabacterium sp. TaxID=1872578 RepID=UPI0035C6A614|nr:DUF2069 domain-containing protein [Pseudomonadota bacterium]
MPLAPIDAPVHDPILGEHPPARLALIARLRSLNVALLLGLIVLGTAWELWLAPLPGGRGTLAIKVLPLAFALTGMLRHRLYTYRWMSLLVWLYFTEGVVRVTGDAGLSQALAGIEVALSVALFAACAVYVRVRLKVLPGKAAKAVKADTKDTA